MSKNRDPLALSPHWHVDCRLAAELPDDSVISNRFLVNLPFGALTLGLLLIFGWNLYKDLNLRFDIANADRRMGESRVEVAGIKQLQLDYIGAAAKIQMAYKLVRCRLFVYHFATELGRTRPEQMTINSIDSTDASVVVRGTLSESFERSAQLIDAYVKQLAQDPEIGPRFREIGVTAFDHDRATDRQNFELTFRYQPTPPL